MNTIPLPSRLITGTVIFLSLSFSGVLSAETFTWVDTDGTRHYGDQPPSNVVASPVETTSNAISIVQNDNSENEQTEDGTSNSNSDPTNTDQQATEIIDRDSQQQMCEKARGDKQALAYEGVIRQKQDDGKMIVISPEQKQEQIELVDEIIAAYCND